ncbi:MAG: EF-hand domain-containing protein [Caulobacteraceae bacterium]
MKRLIPALVLAALPALALAQPPGGGARQPQTPEQVEASFKQMDTNKDGSISKDEWTAAGRREQGFTRFDTNGDGKITLEEMKAVAASFAAGGGGPGGGAPRPAGQ